MQNDIENILFTRFVENTIPFDFLTIHELHKKCNENGYDLSNPHRIKFHALVTITEGESTHNLYFKEETLSPGVMLPLAKDQVHAFSKELKVKGYVVSFEENFITQNISEKNLFHFQHIYHTPSILIGKENVITLNPFIELLKKLHLDANDIMKSEIIHSAFLALLFQIKRLSVYQHKTFESQRFNGFIQFQQLII
jgi:AraC family transcriptional activator of pobA